MQLTTVAQSITLPKRSGLSIHMLFDPGTAETKSIAPKDPSSAYDVNGDDGYEDGICIGGLCKGDVFDALVEKCGGQDTHTGMPQGMLDLINAVQDEVGKWLSVQNKEQASA